VYGDEPVGEISRADLQDLVDQLVARGLSASTVQTPIAALMSVYRRELDRERAKVNPAHGLRMPRVRGRRDRIATPAEAARLIAAVPEGDRAVWATAFYGGLRRGELEALRAEAIDLAASEIRVVSGWDEIEGEQATKGRERRKVPLIPTLRSALAAHTLATGRRGGDLVFGETASGPMDPKRLVRRADKAWEAAGLERVVLHSCRHTFASIAIAAGVNIGTVSAALGHASVKVTWDRYHHLMPGTMEQAAELIEAYIDTPVAEASSGS
jgi:integrase